MNSKLIRKLNIFTVIASIIIPIVFICRCLMYLFDFGSSIPGILFLLGYIVVSTILYWGSLIQGLRAISNGIAGTLKSATIFQFLLYISHMIVSLTLLYRLRHSSDTASRKFVIIITCIFIFMCLMALLKMLLLKDTLNANQVAAGTSDVALKILLFFIVAPIALIIVTIIGIKLVEAYPIIGKIFFTITSIIIIGIAASLFMGVLSVLDKIGLGGVFDYSAGGGSAGGSSSKSSGKTSGGKDIDNEAVAKDLNERYYKEFKNITGESPDFLDYKIIPDGATDDAVRNLRKRMEEEAKEKGVKGKTEYF